MAIESFQNIGAATMGRLRMGGDDGATVTAPNTTKAGKTFAKIADFFSRATNSGRSEQAQQNRDVRTQFADSLRQAFGASADGVLAKMEGKETQPLFAKDMRKMMSEAETLHKIAQVRVQIPGAGGQQVGISPNIIPRATAEALSADDLQAAIQAKVDSGADIVGRLRAGGANAPAGPASAKDVADVMWFLQLRAEAKEDQQFKAGAITMTDPGGRLRDFLDSCPETYQRVSSHIGGFKGHENGAHRGIDLPSGPNDMDGMLPNGRQTVLYARMAKSHAQQMPQEMLFVKMESHGCRITPPGKGSEFSAEGPSRELRGRDVSEFIGHSLSFLDGMKARSSGEHAADSRKERIDKPFIQQFKALIEAAPDDVKQILQRHDPLSTAGGIRVMKQNIEDAREAMGLPTDAMQMIDLDDDPWVDGDENWTPPNLTLHSDGLKSALNQGFMAFEGMVEAKYGPGAHDLRIGNEVILEDRDLP